MNKTKLILGVMVAAVLLLAGCSGKKGADASELLKTIPADASVVMVMDLQKILDDFDCKVQDNRLEPGKTLAKALSDPANGEVKNILGKFQDCGIDWSCASLFSEGYNSYLTGFLDDTAKFKNAVEEDFGEKFEGGEIATCGNIAVANDRFWVCLNSRNTIVLNDIRHFSSLSDKQSILSNENVKKLSSLSTPVAGWGDIKGILNLAGLDFTTRAAVAMGMETIFSDAVEVEWTMDFVKDECVAVMNVLNSKGGVAKFNFPVDKIDGQAVRDLNRKAAGFFALAISERMVKDLQGQTAGQGFSMMGAFVNMMGNVRGTTAIAFGADGQVDGTVSTTGHGVADLSDALSQMGFGVSKEGKNLRIVKGNVEGDLSSAEAAEMLKGSVCGVAMSLVEGNLPGVKSAAFALRPAKGGLEMVISVKGSDSKIPFLLNLVNKK